MVERSMAAQGGGGGGGLSLPPGFRFHPTDEEVIGSYLLNKFLDPEGFVSRAVGEVDLNSCEPRDLPSKANTGEKEWYFFVHKDMKYPTGMRANRATREGYWKATGKDREIFSSTAKKSGAGTGELVGMKKTLVFYTGRAPRGAKTNWVMHEFRLDGKSRHLTINNPKDEWVVCKVFNKKGEGKMTTTPRAAADDEYSAGTATPNASSVVDAGEGAGDFLDSMSMIDGPLYFPSSEYTSSFLPATTTTNTATARTAPPPPYNGNYYDYSLPTTAGSSFNAMPNYSLTNPASNLQMQQVAAMVKNSSVPASNAGDVGSSWNMLNPADGMGRSSSYNVNHHQAIMVKALEGVIGAPNFDVPGKGLPSSTSAAVAGIPPPPHSKLGSYDGEYAYGNYDLDAAKNFGARLY